MGENLECLKKGQEGSVAAAGSVMGRVGGNEAEDVDGDRRERRKQTE